MGKISILVILTIFAFHNTVGQHGVWETIESEVSHNSFFFSLIFLLIDDSKYSKFTEFVHLMRKQMVDELAENLDEYKDDPRLQQNQITIDEFMAGLLGDVVYGDPISELQLEIISKIYLTEIVVCDWTIRGIHIHRRGDIITQRVVLLHHSVNHYGPLYKNHLGTLIKTFPLGDQSDVTRYDDILTVAHNPDYFK